MLIARTVAAALLGLGIVTAATAQPTPIDGPAGIRLVAVPGGTFQSSLGKVTLTEGYAVGVTEVTRAQWRAVMKAEPPGVGVDDLPVADVTYAQAVEFCKQLSEMGGGTFRLPTEAEWERACAGSSASAARDGAHPPSATGNALGVHDAVGNVAEWCLDWWSEATPTEATDPRGPQHGTHRVVRGGSWQTPDATCATRGKELPEARRATIGFRVVRESGPLAVPPGIELVSLESAKQMYDEGSAIFVDARPYAEFVEGHIRGSMHCAVKYFGGATPAKVRQYLPGNAVIVYCHGQTCTDSFDVAVRLKALNLKIGPIYVLREGLPAWIKAGYPTDKGGEVGYQ